MSGLRRLVVFGDSYVQGYRSQPSIQITDLNFPYYLSEELGVEVINKGHHGHSNLAIAHDVMAFIRETPEEELSNYAFLICFSDWQRDTKRDNSREPSPDTDGALEGIVWSRWPNVDAPDPTILRISTEMAYLGLKQLCYKYSIPYRMINSFDHQQCIDRLEVYNVVEHEGGRISDSRIGSSPWRIESPRGDTHWIESNSLYNTILDIIVDQWLVEGDKMPPLQYVRYHRLKEEGRRYLTGCSHPNTAGNQLIAKTLAPYIKEIIKE